MSQALALASRDAAATGEDHAPGDLIELFFFAYREFVADPDRILAEYGFGRAHHRVLHFVSRRPGMPIADLLDVLRITKQSLNRVLKELIDKGFVEQRPGTADRRQRLLHATRSGDDLAERLASVQTRRLSRALAAAEPAGEPAARGAAARFLLAMIDAPEPEKVHRLHEHAGPAPASRARSSQHGP